MHVYSVMAWRTEELAESNQVNQVMQWESIIYLHSYMELVYGITIVYGDNPK